MQTFLPYPSYSKSAKCLDNRRLGKQRVEVLQILRALTGQSKGWRNHPACKMWEGSESGLCLYGLLICDEWISRGFKDTCKSKIERIWLRFIGDPKSQNSPNWLGDDDFHRSHRSNLLRKDERFYRKF